MGNGETAALVGPDLAIRWLCIPRVDGTPVFAGALDPERGGGLLIRLLDESGDPVPLEPDQQAYRGDSAVLETAVAGGGWRLVGVDYMPWGSPCLVREITVWNLRQTAAELVLDVIAAPVQSAAFPTVVLMEAGRLRLDGPGGVLLVAAEPSPDPGTFMLPLGEIPPGASRTVRVLMGYGASAAAAAEGLAAAAGARAAETEGFWERWLQAARMPDGDVPAPWLSGYRRSLVVMKLLSYDRTGALLAAPTASFPAVAGGSDNWDYRFVWLRDGYYAAVSLDAAGLHGEARRFYDLAFRLQGPDGHWHQPLYTVDGQNPAEQVVEDLRGPGGERPIRFGNAASGQLQLDNEGNILHGLWLHYQMSGSREALQQHWDGVRRACGWIASNWQRFESGIWELRDYTAHWVHGKVMCCAGLEVGARIAETLCHKREAAAWQECAALIRAEVVTDGWNPERQAYLRHYGEGTPNPPVDISVLALVFYGLLDPDDPRIKSTVDLMEREQNQGGLRLYGGICRYDYAAVPFYLPTLWLARYYLMSGRYTDCDQLLQTCLECATDLGLMAEHFDGRTRTQWGNFPQMFSHSELSRLILERAQGWSFFQWDERAAGTARARAY